MNFRMNYRELTHETVLLEFLFFGQGRNSVILNNASILDLLRVQVTSSTRSTSKVVLFSSLLPLWQERNAVNICSRVINSHVKWNSFLVFYKT